MDRQTRRMIRDYGATIGVAVVVALTIRFFVIEAYRIPSVAMRPTLEAGDTIFVAKWPFGLRFPWSAEPFTVGREPRRGEVVVFSIPGEGRRDYVKRVVGVAGDTVTIRRGRLSVSSGGGATSAGVEPPAASAAASKEVCGRESLPGGRGYGVCWESPLIEDFGPQLVPAGSVFLLGDFRSQSTSETARTERAEARANHLTAKAKGWGVFPVSLIKGSALWIWLSIEPRGPGWFPQLRFDRMLRRVE